MNKTIRVLVFGATGTGKTSLCNILTGKTRPTDNGALGVTAKSHIYPPIIDGGYTIEIVDTAGLHESRHGTVPAEQAIVALVELLEKARGGFSMLVHVTRASRITDEHDDDYTYFVDKVARNNIPVILAVTGCENEVPLNAWAERNKAAFSRFAYREIVGTCFASGGSLEGFFAPLRADSRQRLLTCIRDHSLAEPYKIYGPGTSGSFDEALTRLWNEFVALAGLPQQYRRQVNESAYSLLKRLGVPQKIAEAAVKHIPDLLEEVGNKTPIPGGGKIARKIAEFFVKKFSSRASAK